MELANSLWTRLRTEHPERLYKRSCRRGPYQIHRFLTFSPEDACTWCGLAREQIFHGFHLPAQKPVAAVR